MSFKRFDLILNNKLSSFKKIINIDSDKSISIRCFLIGSISHNVSTAKNVLESQDVLSTIKCLKKLGVVIKRLSPGSYKIFGKGIGSFFIKNNTTLNFGNSGTLARLLIGILSTTPGIQVKILGDVSLNKRNMRKLIDLMSNFGATFYPKNKFTFPLKLFSSDIPIGINYNAGVSAQLKSAVILAGLNSYGSTKIFEISKSRDHTEKMLQKNTDVIKITKGKKKIIKVLGKKNLRPINIIVPGDPSSAAFFVALALLNKKTYLKIKNVGLNITRTGFYDLLKRSGAKIQFKNLKKQNNETVGDIIVKSSLINPIKASKNYYVNSTDEYPILFIIAALTKGISVFSGIKDLANKESNRISEMQKILKQVGIKTLYSKDKLKIYGKGMIDARGKKLLVPNLGDHRICMSSFVLSILTGAQTKIKNFETVYTSSPSFLKIMKSLGVKFEINK